MLLQKLVSIIIVFILIACVVIWTGALHRIDQSIFTNASTVCIVQKNPYHTEVAVAVAHTLIRNFPFINIYMCGHKNDCITLFVKQYPKNVSIKRNFDEKKCHCKNIIYCTSTEAPLIRLNRVPTLRIGHTKYQSMDMGLIQMVNSHYATLCVQWKKLQEPAFNTPPMIIIIGFSASYSANHKDNEEIAKLIDSGIHVTIISRNLPKTFDRYSNVTCYSNLKQDELVRLLQSSNCLLWTACGKKSWYYKDRMTGSVPAAISCNVPLIMRKKLNRLYDNVPAFTYEESIEELYPFIRNFTRSRAPIYDDFIKQQDVKFVEILKQKNFNL